MSYPTNTGPHDCQEKRWYLCVVVINAISFFTGTVKECWWSVPIKLYGDQFQLSKSSRLYECTTSFHEVYTVTTNLCLTILHSFKIANNSVYSWPCTYGFTLQTIFLYWDLLYFNNTKYHACCSERVVLPYKITMFHIYIFIYKSFVLVLPLLLEPFRWFPRCFSWWS